MANGGYADIAGRTRLVYTRVAVNITDGTRLVDAGIDANCRHTDIAGRTGLVEARVAVRPDGAGIASHPGLIDTAVTGIRHHRQGCHGHGDNQAKPCPG